MRKKCKDPNTGKMIGRYEFGLLSPAEKEIFEEHLSQCNECFRDLYEFSPALEIIKKNINEFRKMTEMKDSIYEKICQKIISISENVWSLFGEFEFDFPKPVRIAIPVTAIVLLAFLMIVVFYPISLFQTNSKTDLKSEQLNSQPGDMKKITPHEPEVMEHKATTEQINSLDGRSEEIKIYDLGDGEIVKIRLNLSEDGEKFVITWSEIADVKSYHIYLIEGEKKERLTPPTGIKETSWFLPVQHIKLNTKYILEISSELKNGKSSNDMKEFVIKK